MDVKDILRNRRIEKKLTLDEVGRLVGVSGATISRWESGDIANMRRDKIVKLANALDLSPAVIMGWSDTTNNDEQHKLYMDVSANTKDDAIFIAIKNMLLANGEKQKASSITKEEAISLYNSLGFDSVKPIDNEPQTIAAHFDGDEYTEDELDEIKAFAEFVKSKRK